MANRVLPADETVSELSRLEVKGECLVSADQANALQIFADMAVWDTVAGKYLQPNKDYQPQDLFRK